MARMKVAQISKPGSDLEIVEREIPDRWAGDEREDGRSGRGA